MSNIRFRDVHTQQSFEHLNTQQDCLPPNIQRLDFNARRQQNTLERYYCKAHSQNQVHAP